MNKEEITHRVEELDQKRKEIVFETLRDVASGVASMAFSKYGAAFKLLKLVGAEAHDAIDSQMSSEVASVVKGVENWKKVSTEELEQIAKLKREMVGKGGWVFEGGTPSDGSNQRIVSDTSYYRFEVSQRIAEMDKYGTKLFFEKYKTQEEFTKFENKLKDPQNGIDEDVANYVLGQDSSLNFETMDRKQLEQVNKAIELMDEIQDDAEADDGAKYFDYLKAKYNRNINTNH